VDTALGTRLPLTIFTYFHFHRISGDNKYGHGGCSATVLNPNQMMVIGGWFPDPGAIDCDSYLTQGQHGMYLGNNSGKTDNAIWAKYDPTMTSYAVPDAVVSVIGGGYGSPQWLHLER
jgi:hypothetical protein